MRRRSFVLSFDAPSFRQEPQAARLKGHSAVGRIELNVAVDDPPGCLGPLPSPEARTQPNRILRNLTGTTWTRPNLRHLSFYVTRRSPVVNSKSDRRSDDAILESSTGVFPALPNGIAVTRCSLFLSAEQNHNRFSNDRGFQCAILFTVGIEIVRQGAWKADRHHL